MEKTWNHKKIRLLLAADTDTAEQFLEQFAPAIYTWSYYQVGADTEVALDLTGRAISRAIKNLSAFDPARQTLFGWLKDQAVQSCDAELEHRQMKPQRPWAWSQLPDDILCGLSRLRCEPLDDRMLSNSFLHEIVQAAMAELDPRDCELITHRFCHLDNEEHIAEEMDCRVEDIQNWLYRSRHSFRREFFQLVASANNGFSESSDTGDIEIQDINLEKLLSTTTIYQSLDEAQMGTIRRQLLQAIEETPQEAPQSRIFVAGMAVILVAALIAGIHWMTRKDSANTPPPPVVEAPTPRQPAPKEPTQSERRRPTQEELDGEELKRIFALGKAGNVDALLEVLKSGQFVSQVAAAHFIGQLAAPPAIDLLEQAEAQWYPEPVDDNPFAKAIDEILIRFPDAAATAVEEEKPEPEIKPDEEKEAKQPPAPTPNITGLVSDFSDQPIANAIIEFSENPLTSTIAASRKIGSIKTNPLGQYQYSGVYEGGVSLTCRISAEDTKAITRSLWCNKEAVCVANIGGKPALTGTAIVNGNPLVKQTLYLSDTLDIADASFTEEVITDEQGNFSFIGVAPDIYSVLHKGLDNRIRRLATIEMPRQEIANYNLDLQTVSFTVEYPADPNTPKAQKAILAYTMDAPNHYDQSQAALTESGTLLFDAILPGSYILKTQLDTGVWVQEQVEIAPDSTLRAITLEPLPEETAFLSGRLLNASPVDLLLISADQRIRIDITPNADGSYELESIPAEIFSLAAFLRGRLIEFTQIDLQSTPEMTLDIDPAEMMTSFCPLTVVVTNTSGIVLSDAQVWLTGSEDLVTASSTGQGAFLAAHSGQYELSVAHPEHPTQNQEVTLKISSLLTEPTPENTIIVQLGEAEP